MQHCEKCHNDFKNAENYRRHIKTCNGLGPIDRRRPGLQTCIFCGKQFPNKANHDRHAPYCEKIMGADLQQEYDQGSSLQQIADKHNVSRRFLSSLGIQTRRCEETTAIQKEREPENFFFGGTRRKSKGEQQFKLMLEREGILESFNVAEQYHLLRYKMDFAFVSIKLDVEIDGMQHYTKPEIKEKDNRREAVLLEAGWATYRIASKDFLARPEVVFSIFKKFLEDRCPCNIVRYPGQVIDGDRKWVEEREKIILNSKINFKDRGWTIKLGEELGICSASARRWVASNMPTFYKESCRTPKADYAKRCS